MVDGYEREYVIHIPASYTGQVEVPLVFMLHGTSGSGDEFYGFIGWKELSETENFIVVYPSSWKYKITENGEEQITTKWNITPDANWKFQEGEKGLDDIKFLRKVIDEMKANYTINPKRIYLNGFSNGGAMAARCAIELSDVLAAVASNASAFYLDTSYVPKRNLPVLFEIGNMDYGPGNVGPEAPMSLFDSLISTPNLPYKNGSLNRIANNYQKNFNLHSEHIVQGDTNFVLVATFQPKNPGPGTGYEFKYIFVKGLDHSYPNGKIHPYDAVRTHWNWMKNFVLEEKNVTPKYTLNVQHGYGGGTYQAGDTVHVWAEEPLDARIFNSWTGDHMFLEEKTNWHTTLIMPNQDVTIDANYLNIPANLNYTGRMIKGPYSNKEIFTYFPPKNKLKGVVWFFPGTGGSGRYWVIRTEEKHMLDLLAAKGYGIITMDAEEVSQNKDLNNDGYLGLQYSFDTINNPDLVNLTFFKNYFIQQGNFDASTPQIAFGFSNGGAFAEIAAGIYNWSCSLTYNTGGNDFMAMHSNVPHYQNNSSHDDGASVGATGNIDAENNYKSYQSRNIKSEWHLQQEQPLHAERFARIPGVSLVQASTIFNYIKQNNLLDAANYLTNDPALLQADYEAHPSKYPVLQSLPQDLVTEIFIQLKVVYTNHLFRSDYDGSAAKFIEDVLGIKTGIDENKTTEFQIVYNNPISEKLHVKIEHNTIPMEWRLLNSYGQEIFSGKIITQMDINFNNLNHGIYFLQMEKDAHCYTYKLVH